VFGRSTASLQNRQDCRRSADETHGHAAAPPRTAGHPARGGGGRTVRLVLASCAGGGVCVWCLRGLSNPC
jgi:hypothetical protein